MTTASGSKRPSANASRDKVRPDRTRLRAQGLRPIQIWVPDTRTRRFAAEAHRQSLLIAASPYEQDDQAFVDSIATLDLSSDTCAVDARLSRPRRLTTAPTRTGAPRRR